MKPKIFLRKLLRGGTGIDDVFIINVLSITDNEVDNTYISNIDLNSDEFTFNEAYVNTYYLHLSIFCYYYIKQTKQNIDRVQFITDSIDKIKDYVKCYVLYKIIIAINSDTRNKNKLIDAIKSTDVFDDFDDSSIKFEKDDTDLNKMKKILSAIALVIKYSYNADFNLKELCSNYGDFTTANSDKLSTLNNYLSTAQNSKNSKKSQEKTAVEKRDILEEIKKEVKGKLKSLRDKLFDKYKGLKSKPESEAAQISDLKIADIIAKAVEISIASGNEPNSKLSELFDDFDKLMDDDKNNPLLKEVREFKENPNNKSKEDAFYEHFYEEYLKSELLKLNEEEINSYLSASTGGKKKVKKSKGGNGENLFEKIAELSNPNDSLLGKFINRTPDAKELFDEEKRKNERIKSIRKRLSFDENQNLLSMKTTYEILAKIGSMDDDNSFPLDADIQRMSDDFKSMAINYKKVSILNKKLMESTLSSANEEELLNAKRNISTSINQEFTETDLDAIKQAIEDLNQLQNSINDAQTIIDIASKLEKGGKRRKNKKGGIGEEPSTINEIEELSRLLKEQTAVLNENKTKLESTMNISKANIEELNKKINEIKLKISVHDEFNSVNDINEKTRIFNEDIRKQQRDFDNTIEALKIQIQEYEASDNEIMKKLNSEKQELLDSIRINIAALKTQKQAITTLIENLKKNMRRKGEIIQQKISEENDAIAILDSSIKALKEELTSRNSIIDSQSEELEKHRAKLTSLESEVIPENIDDEYTSYNSLIGENPIESIIDDGIKESLGSVDIIPEIQEESDGVKQVKDLKEKVGKIIEKLKEVFKQRANYSTDDFNIKDSELFELIQKLITKLREFYDIEIGARPLVKIDGIKDMIKDIINNKIVINKKDDESLINGLIKPYYNGRDTDLFTNFKTTFSNLDDFNFSFKDYLALLKDTDDDQESNMKALLVIIRIIVDLYNSIHKKIKKSIDDIADVSKKTEEQAKNKKREEERMRKAAEELEIKKQQDAENERLRREALDKRRQKLAIMQSQHLDVDKINYLTTLKNKLDTVISTNDNLPKTDYSNLFGLIQDFDFQRSAGNDIQKTKFDTLKAEVSKLLKLEPSKENKKFLESLVVLHPVSESGTTVFNVKKVHNLTTEYTIDSIDDISNNSLEITYKGQTLKFLKDKDGTKIKYLKINDRGNVFIDIGFLSISIKFELLSSPRFDLDEDQHGGAPNTDKPNNIFNAYIIMVMNKIMEMKEADLKDFTTKAMIVQV